MMPDRAGGLPSYAFETFRPLGDWWGKHVGGLSSWAYWLGWFTVAPINAILAANYIIALFSINAGSSTTFGPISSGFGAEVSVTQLIVGAADPARHVHPVPARHPAGRDVRDRARHRLDGPARAARAAAVLKPSKIDFGRLDGFGLPAGVNGSWQLIIGWAFIFTWSVLAMEAAACYIGECRDPARDAKIAMTAEGLFGFFIYVSIPTMVLAVLGMGHHRQAVGRRAGALHLVHDQAVRHERVLEVVRRPDADPRAHALGHQRHRGLRARALAELARRCPAALVRARQPPRRARLGDDLQRRLLAARAADRLAAADLRVLEHGLPVRARRLADRLLALPHQAPRARAPRAHAELDEPAGHGPRHRPADHLGHRRLPLAASTWWARTRSGCGASACCCSCSTSRSTGGAWPRTSAWAARPTPARASPAEKLAE